VVLGEEEDWGNARIGEEKTSAATSKEAVWFVKAYDGPKNRASFRLNAKLWPPVRGVVQGSIFSCASGSSRVDATKTRTTA